MPVIVIVEVAAAAVVAAVRVTVLLPDATAPNVAVTPVGRPDADSVTVVLKPYKGVMAMLLVPLEPGLMLKLAGVAASVKLGGGLTVRAMVALLVKMPEVPVMVTGDLPAAAVLAAVKVAVLLPEATALKVAVTPVGRPEAVNVTVLLKPYNDVMAMLLVPFEPGFTLRLVGVAASVKLGGGFTVSAMVALLVKDPEVPVMVRVDAPVAALLAAVNVAVLLPAVTALNVTVTPAGRPDADNATAPLKPFKAVMAMLLAPLEPWLIAKLAGVAVRVKLG